MGRYRNASYVKSRAVMELVHVLDGGNLMTALILRISAPRLSGSQHRRAPRTRHYSRSTQPLKFGDASSMIVVNVRVENKFDVFYPEAQGFDMCSDLFCGLRQGAVNENMPFIRGDQHGAQTVRSDIVSVSKNAKWFLRTVPLGTL